MRTTLFSMIGVPGSGKSHFAKLLATDIKAIWLNNDGMRSSLFNEPTKPENLHNYSVIYGAMDYATQQALEAGYSVVYDANVNHTRERQKNAKMAEARDADAITIWVKTPFEEAVRRAQSREVTAEQFQAGQETVAKHAAILEEPTIEERCIVIDGTATARKQLTSFKTQVEQLR